ncbi:MAG: glucose-6-phosphate isomerase [Rhizomicrobium sp.]|jgi:glucose-6-phosphate isomerase
MVSESLPFSVSPATGAEIPHFDATLAEVSRGLDWLRAAYDRNTLELLRIPERRDDLTEAREAAEALSKNTSVVAVLGIGGSSLGGQALADLLPFGSTHAPRVIFFDNIDPVTFDAALKSFDLRTARFVAISKSGGTAEPLAQTLAAADAIDRAGGGKYLKHHFTVVTEPGSNPLRAFAESIGCAILDHPVGVGGRYSVLTVVGMLPALLMGLDAEALRKGAAETLATILSGAEARDVPSAAGAALHHALARAGRLRETVLWSYADKLKTFGPWWRQLWAESLGKDGKGTTPVAALGPVDQHSQLQLFLDGPDDALYTMLTTDTAHRGPGIPAARADALGLSYLSGKTMGDLVAAEARATAETLAKRGRPVRRIHAPKLDERTLGSLMMHFMLETILMGRLMGVDPFDQPAVEEGKVLARKYLAARA